VDDRERRKGGLWIERLRWERGEEDRSLAIPTRGQRGEKRASGGESAVPSPVAIRRRKRRRKSGAALDEGMIAVARGNVRR